MILLLKKHRLLRGTIILTTAGFITRIMGFFFRIFLSHAFGEENVGLYQLIFPVYALCLSISTAGIQTAVSRMTAERVSRGKPEEADFVLSAALVFTLVVSTAEFFLLQKNAAQISESFLGDLRCTNLLMIISYSLPCAALHSCICGYSFGLQKTEMPAVSQLIEQTARILFVTTTYYIVSGTPEEASIKLAAGGIVAGELAASLFSVAVLTGHKRKRQTPLRLCGKIIPAFRELMELSIPLTANRTAVTLLQSIEAASIPARLRLYGMNSSDALSIYGVLTGMALPCILFPSAVTNSVSVILLPAVASAQSSTDRSALPRLLKKAIGSCFILGLSCCLFFLITGNLIGTILFHSDCAGRFILTLSWICPFMYTNTALLSCINGLGKTTHSFLINMAGLLVRIGGVYLAIPKTGIKGYLIGLLISQAVISVSAVFVLFCHIYLPRKAGSSK